MNNYIDPAQEVQENIDDIKKGIHVNTDILYLATDWTIETLLNLLRSERINISPNFQRRAAWNTERKSTFIESILLNYPVPQIILAEDKETKKLIVVDGKQRLLTLLQFAETRNADNDGQIYEKFKLTGMDRLTHLENKFYIDLQTDEEDCIETFNNFTIRTIILKQWDKDALYDMFLRINQGSVVLSPQELRQALFPGEFSSFIDRESANSPAIQEIYGTTQEKPDPRMRDAEMLLRFFAIRNYLNTNYKNSIKELLDRTSSEFNNMWEYKKFDLQRQLQNFEDGYKFAINAFDVFEQNGVYPFWKFDNGQQVHRFNKALFDIIIYYFSFPEIINNIKTVPNYKQILKENFKGLFNNQSFADAVTYATNSTNSFQIRFSEWSRVLSNITNTNIESPL